MSTKSNTVNIEIYSIELIGICDLEEPNSISFTELPLGKPFRTEESQEIIISSNTRPVVNKAESGRSQGPYVNAWHLLAIDKMPIWLHWYIRMARVFWEPEPERAFEGRIAGDDELSPDRLTAVAHV